MPRILVAEDSYALANLLSFVLENAGLEVDLHRAGDTAMSASLSERYDVILLDQQMPHRSGLEIIESLRSQGPNLDTPVFLCTAKTHELDIEQQQVRLRINQVFQKPFSPKDLVHHVTSATQTVAVE